MRGLRIDLEFLICNYLAEFDAIEKVTIGRGILRDNRIRPHVLDIGFDQRRAIPDELNGRMLSDNGPINQAVLGGREFAHGHYWIVLLLLCSKMREPRG